MPILTTYQSTILFFFYHPPVKQYVVFLFTTEPSRSLQFCVRLFSLDEHIDCVFFIQDTILDTSVCAALLAG